MLKGRIEGWYEEQRRRMGPGHVLLAPANVVHACYNDSKQPVKLLVVLTPLLPAEDEEWEIAHGYGWEMVDVSDQAPWKTLRKTSG